MGYMKRFEIALVVLVSVVVGAGLTFLVQKHRAERMAAKYAWNSKAITATYLGVETGVDDYIHFLYSLKNNTDHDYTSAKDDGLSVNARLSEGMLSACDDCIEVPSIFIPAHDSLQVVVTLKYKFPGGYTAWDDPHRKEAQVELRKYLNTQQARLNGFTLLDKPSRYKIEFPNGWK